MALLGVSLLLLFLAGDLTASTNSRFGQPSEYKREMLRYHFLCAKHCSRHFICDNYEPNCYQYRLPGCPRDFSPVCGSDMTTYPNECTLCVKIREGGHNIKIVRDGPC